VILVDEVPIARPTRQTSKENNTTIGNDPSVDKPGNTRQSYSEDASQDNIRGPAASHNR